MGDAEPVGDLLGIINVLPRATGARSADRLPMIVELESHSDDLRARAGGKRGRDRAVDSARHGDDDPGVAHGAADLEIHLHLKTCFPVSLPEFHSSPLDTER